MAAAVSPGKAGHNPGRGDAAGQRTTVLRERWPEARLLGADASEDMLEAARKAMPGTPFVQADLNGELSGLGAFDLVFSNAVLQWLPDPGEGLSRLFALVKPGGALAAQVPACNARAFSGGGGWRPATLIV